MGTRTGHEALIVTPEWASYIKRSSEIEAGKLIKTGDFVRSTLGLDGLVKASLNSVMTPIYPTASTSTAVHPQRYFGKLAAAMLFGDGCREHKRSSPDCAKHSKWSRGWKTATKQLYEPTS